MTDRATRRKQEREASKKQQRDDASAERSLESVADRFIHEANLLMMNGQSVHLVVEGMMYGTARFMANYASAEAAENGIQRGMVTDSLLKAMLSMYEHHSLQFATQDGQLKGQAPLEQDADPISRPKGIWDTQEHILTRTTSAIEALPQTFRGYLRGRGLPLVADDLEDDWLTFPAKADRLKVFCQKVDALITSETIPVEVCIYVLLQSLMPLLVEIVPGGYVADPVTDEGSRKAYAQVFAQLELSKVGDLMARDVRSLMEASNKGMQLLFGKLAEEFHSAFQSFERSRPLS